MSEFARRFAARQIIGARERQEDDYAALDLSGNGQERLLFVVADGMGGHRGAAAAAQLAVRRFCEIAKNCDGTLGQRLPIALAGANDAVAKAAILDGTLEGAGCAFLSAAVDDGALSWISVGDCSLLLFRRGKLRKLNDDHSMRPVLAEMVAAGRLSAKEAAQDPRRHSLRSALKGSEIRLIDNSPAPVRLIPGDSVILASDGFETLSTRAVTKLLRRGTAGAPTGMVERLIAAIRAARARNQDNATVIFYHFADINDVAHKNARRGMLWLLLAAALLFAGVYGLYISTR
jgi:PPM family protein phosphatase